MYKRVRNFSWSASLAFSDEVVEINAGGDGDHAGKVDLLNFQEHRKLGEVFDSRT